MKYIVIVCMLFASCSLFRKTVNTEKKETHKSSLSLSDRVDSVSVLSTAISKTFGSAILKVDSGYEKVTEEMVKEVIDSVGIHRETIRTIKEKGQKRIEQASQVVKYDSGAAMITEHSQLQELQTEDSTAAVITTKKDVNRSTLFPWWSWLIAAAVAGLGWWKRNSIIEFFT